MGISKTGCHLLFYAKTLGVSFAKTLTLGRQNLYASKTDIASDIAKYRNADRPIEAVVFKDEYAEPLFEILGASQMASLDKSNFENASILHDLNAPIPESYHDSFTAIFDGGTIEHVFNFPVAIKSCMEALEVGGHYMGLTPANNFLGHGFYQFSPELYFRIFSEENGFEVTKALIYAEGSETSVPAWYEVSDPKRVGGRVMLVNDRPVVLFVIAKKIRKGPIFAPVPLQSDYADAWSAHAPMAGGNSVLAGGKLRRWYRKSVPRRLRIIFRNAYDLMAKERETTAELGVVDPKHFHRIDI